MNSYRTPRIIREKSGNNAFAWEERTRYYGKSPTLIIPSLIFGNIDDIETGGNIVFEEIKNGELQSCLGLKHFVHLEKHHPEITIFDNHNHALYFWIDAIRRGILKSGFTLVHIDQHSDLWENPNTLNIQCALKDEEYAWKFVNIECNVGNYISPAIDAGIVGEVIRIENEFQVEENLNIQLPKNTVLNIDMDFFSLEMNYFDEKKKIELIQNLIPQVDCVTIATSPYFIEPGLSIKKLKMLLTKEN